MSDIFPTRVILIDDHPSMMLATKLTIEDDPQYVVVASARSGAEGVEQAIELKPDIAVVDLKLPDMSGIAVCKTIKESLYDIHCILFTGEDYNSNFEEIADAGISGILGKRYDPMFLMYQLNCVREGLSIVPTDHYHSALRSRQHLSDVRFPDMDLMILYHLMEGCSTSEVSKRLHVSPKTIEHHLTQIFRQLNVSRREEAIEVFRSMYEGRLKKRVLEMVNVSKMAMSKHL